ncbi:hypothetical protein SAICODRAFT_117065 [Saitoella complicata NRRL Y-17804]|nr:uncharacterized protein SAICODRAFT_117065 [Saitoella complicata NRRL Y-17804]ODQ53118.1 hypothetical protein SAICODRAFT_117065 [Saitoella complicata NRRL Y-17804]
MSPTLIQRQASILNDLSLLVALGSLTLHLPPPLRLPGPGCEAGDGWLWSPPFEWCGAEYRAMMEETEREVFGLLGWLSERGWVRYTYQIIPREVTRAVVRVYAVPEDVDGRRFLPGRTAMEEKRGRKALRRVMEVLDASAEMWVGNV